MKVCGVIVEYNPFHNGHVYHLEQARKKTQADVVVAVMSGNWVERGAPACMDKWQRAAVALSHGVDVVIELPTSFVLQSADYFAKGAVALLHEMACDFLVFGTDRQTIPNYAGFGEKFVQKRSEINQKIRCFQPKTLAFPQKMTEVFKEVFPEMPVDFHTPNHILAMSYAKENAQYPHPMTLFPIKRKTADYHDGILSKNISSATAIRKHWHRQEEIRQNVPQETAEIIEKKEPISWENYFHLLKYKIETTPVKELGAIYLMREGLEYRFKEQIKKAETFETLMEQLATKRYTKARLQRLCCYILGNITSEEIQAEQKSSVISVLGFTKKGRAYLHYLKKEKSKVFSTNYAKETEENTVSYRFDNIYLLANATISEQRLGRKPIC